MTDSTSDMGTLRLAYADPPYLGCCALYEHRHEPPYGCWNEPETHAALIGHLVTGYPDGWALSASSKSLRTLLPMCPDEARVAAWVKPWCSFNAANPAFAWEPVIFSGGRNKAARGGRESVTVRDWLAESITLRTGTKGAKPGLFCRWVVDLLGYQEGDELVDVFPGTGVMGRVLAQGRLAV